MATTAQPLTLPGAPARRAEVPAFLKRFVNALVASRARAAEVELRRHDFLLRETALTHGPYRSVAIETADLLPFNR